MAVFLPTNADSLSVVIGVTDTIDNCIIQNYTVSESTPTLTIQDQFGRTAQVIAYDKEYNISMTAIGGTNFPLSVGQVDTTHFHDQYGNSLSAVITNVERACTYNDTAKWNVQATASGKAKFWNAVDHSLGDYQH